MGLINRFLDDSFYNQFKFDSFVETGTGFGYSLKTAIQHPFKRILTVDIDGGAVEGTKRDIRDGRVDFFTQKSEDFIKEQVNEGLGVTLFWLDAHFPFSFSNGGSFGVESSKRIAIPLEFELGLIKECKRDYHNDVFVIDDLRIYEDGPFGDGNWADREKYGGNGIEFIVNNFEKTHSISKDYRDQGYIILTPK